MSTVTPPWFMLALVFSLAVGGLRAGELAEGWELLVRHLPVDAAVHIDAAHAAPRERALAQAVAQMETQPRTDERMRDVAAQLTALSQETDEVGATAAYLVARIYQTHLFAAEPIRAAQAYERVISLHASSPWAQLARVKLAVLTLYVLPQPSVPAARVAAAEALLAQIGEPSLRRDLLIVIGRARLFYGLPEAIPPLVEAARIGGLVGVPRGDLLVQIGELSRRAGDTARARAFFRQYLAENEVDPRVFAVAEKLKEMDAAEAAPTAGGVH